MNNVGLSGVKWQTTPTNSKETSNVQHKQKPIDRSVLDTIGAKPPRLDINNITTLNGGKPIAFTGPVSESKVNAPNIVDNSEDYFGSVRTEGKCIDVKVTEYRSVYPKYTADGLLDMTPDWNARWFSGDGDNGDRYFFHASTDFLLDAANKYAKIEDNQEFMYRPTEDADFVSSMLDFFHDGKATPQQFEQLRSEIDVAVRELAGKIKKGESTDINQLKSTITIADKKLTFKDIKEIQANSAKFAQSLGQVGSGTEDFGYMAQRGLAKGMAMAYGDSLGGKFGEIYKKAFAAGADRSQNASIKLAERLNTQSGDSLVHSANGQSAFELFSTVRNQFDFSDAMNRFESLINQYSKTMAGGADAVLMKHTKNELQKTFDALR